MQRPEMSNQLNEGLKAKDLEHFVSNLFSVDTYQSKMGEDRDVSVVSFRVKDRLPAMDLMEFLERGYTYVLDADISSGEESDGKYSVFVEIERDRYLPERIAEMLGGVGRLTGINEWRYRYYKEWRSKDFSIESITEDIPLDPDTYDSFLHESKVGILKGFFDQSVYDDIVIHENNVTLVKPFDNSITFELQDVGQYNEVMSRTEGNVKLDEQALAETVYLNKIFGDYEIIKLSESFLIKKNNHALLIKLI